MAALLKHAIKQPALLKVAESITGAVNLNARRNFKAKWVAPTLRELKRRKDIEDERNGGPKIFHRSTFLDWNYDAELYAFGNRLGEKFDDTLLRKALTHASYLEKQSNSLGIDSVQVDNKRMANDDLALAGEQLMSSSIKGYLRAIFSRIPEEFIQSLHDHLVSSSTLAKVAKNIGLSDIILCVDFPCEEATLAKSLMAVIGALEQSSGQDRAKVFVQDLIITQLYGQDINAIWNPIDPVGIFCSILLRDGRAEPEFRLIRSAGTNTVLSVYHVGIYSNKELLATGAGENIEIAQEMAALDGLKRLFHTEDAMKALPFGRQLKSLQGKVTSCENKPNLRLSEWSSEKVSRLAM